MLIIKIYQLSSLYIQIQSLWINLFFVPDAYCVQRAASDLIVLLEIRGMTREIHGMTRET